jgi:hypothetical protein
MKPANPADAPKAVDKAAAKEKDKAVEYPVDPVEPAEAVKGEAKKGGPDNVPVQQGATSSGGRSERGSSGGGAMLWIVLLLVLLLVVGGVVAYFVWFRNADEGRSRKRSKSKAGKAKKDRGEAASKNGSGESRETGRKRRA